MVAWSSRYCCSPPMGILPSMCACQLTAPFPATCRSYHGFPRRCPRRWCRKSPAPAAPAAMPRHMPPGAPAGTHTRGRASRSQIGATSASNATARRCEHSRLHRGSTARPAIPAPKRTPPRAVESKRPALPIAAPATTLATILDSALFRLGSPSSTGGRAAISIQEDIALEARSTHSPT